MRKYALSFAIFLLAFVTFSEAQTGQTTVIRTGTSDPSSCATTAGGIYWNATAKRLKGCPVTNTWDTIPFLGQANTHSAGAKNTFTPSTTTAGFNLVKLSGQPSSPADGDLNNNAGNLELYVTSAWRRFAFVDSNITGNANTATAFQANGTNCGAGQAAAGVDASGNAENCFTPSAGSASSVTSGGTNPAATGVVKLANGEKVCWRNAANSADLCIYLDASNIWNLDGASSTIFTYANATAPGTPSAGNTNIYVDSTNKALSAKNDAGNVSTTVFGQTVSSNLYVQSILADGTISRKQIAYSEISGTPVVPVNTTSTATQFLTAYNSGTGAYTKAQPAFTDISGTATSAQLPNPGASAGGKVQSKDCTGTGHILSLNTDSTVACSADAVYLTTVNTQTTSYTVGTGDFNASKLISISNAGATTLTLLATAPTSGQHIYIQNTGAGTVTVSRNTNTIDGFSADLTLNQNQGIMLISDGTHYFTQRGSAALSGGLNDPGSNGMVARTGSGTTVNRTITGNTQVSVSNGDGVSGNPTLGINSASIGSTQLVAANKSDSRCVTIFDPVSTDTGRVLLLDLPMDVTITRAYGAVKAATNVVFNLDKRAEGTIDTAGTTVLTSDLTATTSGANTTTMSSASVTAHTPVMLKITSVSGTPDTFRACVDYTIN